ncbi:hypothetical protein B0H10DRAFT_192627 [Mycena sp. CBHHK59/15]|nr:hypothetical protein B0H10DRAFT_192627 [Mycena sp. CBHHK59/15]
MAAYVPPLIGMCRPLQCVCVLDLVHPHPRGTVHGARISISTCVANDDGNPSCRAKYTFCFSSVGAPLTSITYVAAVRGGTCIFTNIGGTLGNAAVRVDASCLEDDGNRHTVANFNIGQSAPPISNAVSDDLSAKVPRGPASPNCNEARPRRRNPHPALRS